MTAALEGGEWSVAHPGRTLPLRKTRYTFLQKVGWARGPVWTSGKSRPHRNSIPDRPARKITLTLLKSYNNDETGIYIYSSVRRDIIKMNVQEILHNCEMDSCNLKHGLAKDCHE